MFGLISIGIILVIYVVMIAVCITGVILSEKKRDIAFFLVMIACIILCSANCSFAVYLYLWL